MVYLMRGGFMFFTLGKRIHTSNTIIPRNNVPIIAAMSNIHTQTKKFLLFFHKGR